MRRGLVLLLAGAAALPAGCDGGTDTFADEAAPRSESIGKLPLAGKTPTGQRYRLGPGSRQRDDDVPLSWCLRLRYDVGITFVEPGGKRNTLAGGTATCGRRPVPPVSGSFSADCERRSVFIFGGATSRAGSVTLVTSRGKRIAARQAKLPKGSGFRGTAFLVTASVNDLPARLRSKGAGNTPGTRFPARSRVCLPLPGSPEGGEPFGSFP